jgi:hypothetical protein
MSLTPATSGGDMTTSLLALASLMEPLRGFVAVGRRMSIEDKDIVLLCVCVVLFLASLPKGVVRSCKCHGKNASD